MNPVNSIGHVIPFACRLILVRLLVVCLVAACSVPAQAQSVWEVSPYSVKVWCVFGDEPDLPADWQTAFVSQLNSKLRVIFRAVCAGEVQAAPAAANGLLSRGIAELTAAELLGVAPELAKQDKVFFVHLSGGQAGYRIRVREYDAQLAHFGPTDEVTFETLSGIPGRAAQMIADAFSPVARIDRFVDGRVKARLRAGSLIRGEDALGTLQENDVLLPFDRRVASDGTTPLKNIRPIDWTYLRVPPPVVDETNATSTLTGLQLEVVSGFKQPFRSKRNRRNQQLALRARPKTPESIIRLQTRAAEPTPLIGYEIHEKGQNKTTNFLGYTDWRGQLPIARSAEPIRILLVRTGDRVIAKLPIVPGLRPEIVAAMRDDRQRVETDGFLTGVQTALIDLVARRESLTARIRNLAKAGEIEDAEELLENFRDLPGQEDFQREIQRQQRMLNVTDPGLRKRIDTMFVQTYRTLGKYLDPNRLRQLEAEVAAAK